MADWFQQNAPSAKPAGGNWFEQNAPPPAGSDDSEGFVGGFTRVVKSAAQGMVEGSKPSRAGDVGASLITAHAGQFLKAKDAYSKGHYSEAFGHMLAMILPGVGPAAAEAADRMGGEAPSASSPGRKPDIAGGAGEGAGLIATTLAGGEATPERFAAVGDAAIRGTKTAATAAGDVATGAARGVKARAGDIGTAGVEGAALGFAGGGLAGAKTVGLLKAGAAATRAAIDGVKERLALRREAAAGVRPPAEATASLNDGNIQPGATNGNATAEGSEVSGSGSPGARSSPGRGLETDVLIPGEDRAIGARYDVRELSDIQPSHNGETFLANPKYQLKNERDYSKPENRQRVITNSSEESFNPRYHVTDNPDATNGPVVIDEAGNAMGGNQRSMILQRVYNRGQQGAQAYRSLLQEKAAQYGLDPAEVAGMKQPVLVRVVGNDELASLPGGSSYAIRKTNIPGTAALSSSERALSDAGQLQPEMVGRIGQALADAGEDATLNDALTGKKGTAIVNKLISDGFFSEQERPSLMDGKTGALTQLAKDRISKSLLGQFFRDSDQLARTPASIRGKLERSAAPLAAVSKDPQWNLAPDLQQAVDLTEYAQAHDIKNLRDVTAQQSLIEGEKPKFDESTVRLAELLRDAKPNDLVAALRKYVNSKGVTMWGESTPQEAFQSAFGFPKPAREIPVEAPAPAAPPAPAARPTRVAGPTMVAPRSVPPPAAGPVQPPAAVLAQLNASARPAPAPPPAAVPNPAIEPLLYSSEFQPGAPTPPPPAAAPAAVAHVPPAPAQTAAVTPPPEALRLLNSEARPEPAPAPSGAKGEASESTNPFEAAGSKRKAERLADFLFHAGGEPGSGVPYESALEMDDAEWRTIAQAAKQHELYEAQARGEHISQADLEKVKKIDAPSPAAQRMALERLKKHWEAHHAAERMARAIGQ